MWVIGLLLFIIYSNAQFPHPPADLEPLSSCSKLALQNERLIQNVLNTTDITDILINSNHSKMITFSSTTYPRLYTVKDNNTIQDNGNVTFATDEDISNCSQGIWVEDHRDILFLICEYFLYPFDISNFTSTEYIVNNFTTNLDIGDIIYIPGKNISSVYYPPVLVVIGTNGGTPEMEIWSFIWEENQLNFTKLVNQTIELQFSANKMTLSTDKSKLYIPSYNKFYVFETDSLLKGTPISSGDNTTDAIKIMDFNHGSNISIILGNDQISIYKNWQLMTTSKHNGFATDMDFDPVEPLVYIANGASLLIMSINLQNFNTLIVGAITFGISKVKAVLPRTIITVDEYSGINIFNASANASLPNWPISLRTFIAPDNTYQPSFISLVAPGIDEALFGGTVYLGKFTQINFLQNLWLLTEPFIQQEIRYIHSSNNRIIAIGISGDTQFSVNLYKETYYLPSLVFNETLDDGDIINDIEFLNDEIFFVAKSGGILVIGISNNASSKIQFIDTENAVISLTVIQSLNILVASLNGRVLLYNLGQISSNASNQTILNYTVTGSYDFNGYKLLYNENSTYPKLYSYQENFFFQFDLTISNNNYAINSSSMYTQSWSSGIQGIISGYIFAPVEEDGVVIHDLSKISEDIPQIQLRTIGLMTTPDFISKCNSGGVLEIIAVTTFGFESHRCIAPTICKSPPGTTTSVDSTGSVTGTTTTTQSSNNDPKNKSNDSKVGLGVGVAVALIAIIVASVLAILFIMKRKKKNNKRNDDLSLETSARYELGLSGKESPQQNKSKPLPTRPPTHDSKRIPELTGITILKRLGGGNFGEVYLGSWDGTEVALKKMKNQDDFSNFEKEAYVLMSLGNHPYVVQFLGKFITGNDQYIVTEYVQMGSLSDYIAKNKKILTFADLFNMIWTATKGMAFLEKKKVVHRDIAARNFLVCQINGNYSVKISDFGMSKEADQEYYKSSNFELPIRWCAPEVLTNRKFSGASDVWSFAVAIWEILSLGQLPYYWLNNRDIAEKIAEGHERLKKPAVCPDELWKILEPCFDDDPAKRPSFQQLLLSLMTLNAEQNYVIVETKENFTESSEVDQFYR